MTAQEMAEVLRLPHTQGRDGGIVMPIPAQEVISAQVLLTEAAEQHRPVNWSDLWQSRYGKPVSLFLLAYSRWTKRNGNKPLRVTPDSDIAMMLGAETPVRFWFDGLLLELRDDDEEQEAGR